MATFINNMKSGNGKRTYSLDISIESKTDKKVKLKIDLTMKFNEQTLGDYIQRKVEVYCSGISKNSILTMDLPDNSYWNDGTAKTATSYITIDRDSADGYNLKPGTISCNFYWNKPGYWDLLEKYSVSVNSTNYLWVAPAGIEEPEEEEETYNIIASATSTINTATLFLGGLPYNSNVLWYIDGKMKDSSNIYSSNGSYTFRNLAPSTNYVLRGIVSINGQTIGVGQTTISTKAETGTLDIETSSRSIIATVSGMSSNPSYARTVTFNIYSPDTGHKDSQSYFNVMTNDLTHVFSGLSINTEYNVSVQIKNGAIELKNLTSGGKTDDDFELVPKARIISLKQKKMATTILVNWDIDKKASGTIYTFEIKRDGVWSTAKILTKYESIIEIPVSLESSNPGENVEIRIKAFNEYLSDKTSTSDAKGMYLLGNYSFTTPKISGQPLIITAEEWNRLIFYTKEKAKNYDLSFDISDVEQGQSISANTYNEVKNAINSMYGINIQDKKTGNPISAADINALRTAINNA